MTLETGTNLQGRTNGNRLPEVHLVKELANKTTGGRDNLVKGAIHHPQETVTGLITLIIPVSRAAVWAIYPEIVGKTPVGALLTRIFGARDTCLALSRAASKNITKPTTLLFYG